MTKKQKALVRYSDCFKLSIVEEIEKNGLSIEDCSRKYDIKGGSTIQNWLEKYGKNHLLNKVVRVETKDEVREIELLRKELAALKKAYAELALENKVNQTVIEVSDEMFGTDLKKKSEQELLKYFPKRKK